MKYCVALLLFLTATVFEMKAEVDPKFQIYLCFGQSNMEGGVPAENIDKEYVDPRFQLLATDATNENRAMGNWYPAYPNIVGLGGLCPIDYFGRSMVAALPADYKVGVVAVASGGVDIRAFFPETGSNYIEYKKVVNNNHFSTIYFTNLVILPPVNTTILITSGSYSSAAIVIAL